MSSAPSAQRWPKLVKWLFASFNLVFIVLAFVGLLPGQLGPLWRDALGGRAPWSMLGFVLLLLVVPPLCLVLGLRQLRADPDRLLRLFYGVEVPLLVMAGLRLFVLHELTPAHGQILVALATGALAYLYDLRRELSAAEPARLPLWLQLAAQSLGFLVAVYLLVIYTPPAAVTLFGFLSQQLERGWLSLLMLLFLALPFWLAGALLFVVAPVMQVRLYARSLRQLYRAAQQSLGPRRAAWLPVSVALLNLALFVALNRQPQNPMHVRLHSPLQSNEERQALLRESDALRRGFLNAYLADERYLGLSVPMSLLADELPNASLRMRARGAVYRLYGAIARPFLFDNQLLLGPRQEASAGYARFFDAPIEMAERPAILAARSARLFADEREKNYRADSEQKVWRSRQAVSSERHGDWAEVELHEVYESQSGAGEEILIYFSLPESAVITGLWTANSDERQSATPFLVAARFSQLERRGRRSPQHVLEQIGPRQYRLRATIEVEAQAWQRGQGKARPCHLWLRYRILGDGLGFSLPQRLSERNVYDTAATQRVIDGRVLGASEPLPTQLLGATPAIAHQAVIDGVQVHAQPVAAAPEPPLHQRRLAVIIDRSLSMQRVRSEAEGALRALRGLAPDNDLDFYLSSAPLRGEPPARIDDPALLPESATLFFGGDRLYSMLEQFQALRGDTRYDGVLLLTDGESLDATRDPELVAPSLPPLWLVHLGGQLGAGYSDAVQQAIWRSGGGVTTTLASALASIERAGSGAVGQLVDGYLWTFSPAEPGSPPSQEAFAALAAARLIAWRGQARPGQPLSSPSEQHRLAVEYGLATPQSALLRPARQPPRIEVPAPAIDRFALDVPSGDDTLPGSYEVSGSPEPAVWLLLAAALLYLVYEHRRSRAGDRSRPRALS